MLRRRAGRVPHVDLALRLAQHAPHVAAEPHVAGVPGLPRPGVGRELAQGDTQHRDPVQAPAGRGQPAGLTPHPGFEVGASVALSVTVVALVAPP